LSNLPVKWIVEETSRRRPRSYKTASFGSNALHRLPGKVSRLARKLYYRHAVIPEVKRLSSPKNRTGVLQLYTQLRGRNLELDDPKEKRAIRRFTFHIAHITRPLNAYNKVEKYIKPAFLGAHSLYVYKHKNLKDWAKDEAYRNNSASLARHIVRKPVAKIASYAASKITGNEFHSFIAGKIAEGAANGVASYAGSRVYNKFRSEKLRSAEKEEWDYRSRHGVYSSSPWINPQQAPWAKFKRRVKKIFTRNKK
jgi:hypothetical protein